MIEFEAQFKSDCGNCEFPVEKGQAATFEDNEAVHIKCPKVRPACPDCWLVHGTAQEFCE